MKKVFSSVLVVMLLFSLSVTCYAEASYDLNSLTDKELTELFSQVKSEMTKRKLSITNEITLTEGMYVIGEELMPGTYIITCTKTDGESLGGLYSNLGEAVGSLDDSVNWGSLFGALGGMVEEVATTTVEIVGDYGSVLKSYELKSGSTISINLTEKTALKVSGGSIIVEQK